MTHRGLFQPLPFCESVISLSEDSDASLASLQRYVGLSCALAVGDALIASCNDTVGSMGMGSLADAVADPSRNSGHSPASISLSTCV